MTLNSFVGLPALFILTDLSSQRLFMVLSNSDAFCSPHVNKILCTWSVFLPQKLLFTQLINKRPYFFERKTLVYT